MQDGRSRLGEQELEILRYVDEQAPVTARQVAERFGEERGLARTTVATVLERLRKKGYLTRRPQEGGFEYSPRLSQPVVMQGLVQQFIERTLGGSVSPVVAYLTRTKKMTRTDLAELEQLVVRLKAEAGDPAEGER
jgi:predicted transcriptional regulator